LRLSIYELAEQRNILAGSAPGRKLLAALIAATPSADVPEAVFLDFSGVEVVTSSFLRESVIGFRDFARNSLQNIYPVVANAASAVVEELEFFARHRGDVLWCCVLNQEGAVSNARIIGELDPAQRATFDTVVHLGVATAPELAAQSGGDGIGPTAWNNRLSALAAKGLLVERRGGKTKSFSPLLGTA
jgi:STAS-like domain of unknown function (DUF4325)